MVWNSNGGIGPFYSASPCSGVGVDVEQSKQFLNLQQQCVASMTCSLVQHIRAILGRVSRKLPLINLVYGIYAIQEIDIVWPTRLICY